MCFLGEALLFFMGDHEQPESQTFKHPFCATSGSPLWFEPLFRTLAGEKQDTLGPTTSKVWATSRPWTHRWAPSHPPETPRGTRRVASAPPTVPGSFEPFKLPFSALLPKTPRDGPSPFDELESALDSLKKLPKEGP